MMVKMMMKCNRSYHEMSLSSFSVAVVIHNVLGSLVQSDPVQFNIFWKELLDFIVHYHCDVLCCANQICVPVKQDMSE